jgi:hypothetical protein
MTTGNKNPLLFPLEKGDGFMLPLVRGERFAKQIRGVYPAKRRCSTSSSCLSRRSLGEDGRLNLQRQSTKDDKIRDFSTSVEMTA